MNNASATYFAGPDLEKYALRNRLIQSIQAVPAQGCIRWLCYYLNDADIFQALISAAQRGVQVLLIIDAGARSKEINLDCIAEFAQQRHTNIHLLALQKQAPWEKLGLHWHPHLHSKLYFFSHPQPHVYIGSFNPTAGADSLPAAMIEKIGDHAISHNVLVRIDEANTVEYLKTQFTHLSQYWSKHCIRFTKPHRRRFQSRQWTIDLLPQLGNHPVNQLMRRPDRQAQVKCAISHLKGPGALTPIKIAINSGKSIELILESSQRRVPARNLAFLEKQQIKYHQLELENNCLMHNKFIIFHSEQTHCVMFGSFNWSARSRYLNHEIIACTDEISIVQAFEQRWQQLTGCGEVTK